MEDYRERARKRAAERSAGFWYKLVPGDDGNTFRILPTPKSKKTPAVFMEYGVHREVGKDKKTLRCGKDPVTGEGKCWLCDKKIPELEEAGKTSRASALVPQSVTIMQVAKVTGEGKKARFDGPYGFNPSKKVGDLLIGKIIGSKKRDYVDPENGYNITISREGTGKLDTKYGPIEPDNDPTAVPETIIAKLKPFSEVKEIPAYNEEAMKAAYSGKDYKEPEDDDADEGEDEDDEPKPAKKAKKPAADDDDDDTASGDDDDDDAVPDDDDDDTPPPPKKKKKVVEEDDDEADAEPEADEEDEPPAKKKKLPPPPPPKKKK